MATRRLPMRGVALFTVVMQADGRWELSSEGREWTTAKALGPTVFMSTKTMLRNLRVESLAPYSVIRVERESSGYRVLNVMSLVAGLVTVPAESSVVTMDWEKMILANATLRTIGKQRSVALQPLREVLAAEGSVKTLLEEPADGLSRVMNVGYEVRPEEITNLSDFDNPPLLTFMEEQGIKLTPFPFLESSTPEKTREVSRTPGVLKLCMPGGVEEVQGNNNYERRKELVEAFPDVFNWEGITPEMVDWMIDVVLGPTLDNSADRGYGYFRSTRLHIQDRLWEVKSPDVRNRLAQLIRQPHAALSAGVTYGGSLGSDY